MFKTARREFWNFPTWEWASSGDLKSFSTGAEEKSRVSEGHRKESRPLRDKEGRGQVQPEGRRFTPGRAHGATVTSAGGRDRGVQAGKQTPVFLL